MRKKSVALKLLEAKRKRRHHALLKIKDPEPDNLAEIKRAKERLAKKTEGNSNGGTHDNSIDVKQIDIYKQRIKKETSQSGKAQFAESAVKKNAKPVKSEGRCATVRSGKGVKKPQAAKRPRKVGKSRKKKPKNQRAMKSTEKLPTSSAERRPQRAAKSWATTRLEYMVMSQRRRYKVSRTKKKIGGASGRTAVSERQSDAMNNAVDTRHLQSHDEMKQPAANGNCGMEHRQDTAQAIHTGYKSCVGSTEKPHVDVSHSGKACPGGLRTYIAIMEKKSGNIGFYDIAKNSFRHFTRMEMCMDSFSCIVTLDEELYLLDGQNLFLFEKTSWKQMDSVGFRPSSNAKAIVFQHFIYIMDTYGMAWYDSTLDMWEECSDPLPFGNNFCLAVLDGCIYIIGWGSNYKRVMRHDPVKGESREITSTMMSRMGASAASFNGLIYVMGGIDRVVTNQVERFDPTANMWTFIAPMSIPRVHLCVFVLGDRIYAVGGAMSGRPDSIEVCEKVGGVYRWQTLHEMYKIETPFSAAVISTVLL